MAEFPEVFRGGYGGGAVPKAPMMVDGKYPHSLEIVKDGKGGEMMTFVGFVVWFLLSFLKVK